MTLPPETEENFRQCDCSARVAAEVLAEKMQPGHIPRWTKREGRRLAVNPTLRLNGKGVVMKVFQRRIETAPAQRERFLHPADFDLTVGGMNVVALVGEQLAGGLRP